MNKNKIINILKIIITVIMLVLSLLCYKFIYDMGIVPDKYLYLFLTIIIIMNILASMLLFLKGIITKIFSIMLYIIIAIVSVVGIKYSYNTIEYLNTGFDNSVEYTTYSVVVLKDSLYDDLNDLLNKNIGYLFIDVDSMEYLNYIKEKLDAEYIKYDLFELYNGLIDKNIDSIVVNDAYLNLLSEQFNDFDTKIKVVYSYNIENKDTEDEEDVVSVLKPINIYLSGSDSRSGYISTNTNSDVNMIVTINPNTHTILLTNIPRDYYVQLHGTSGLKDKLTHAGIYGLDMSRKTIEDLFGIEIDYSVKVGFSSVVKLVDLVGGIDVYSDTAFKSLCGDGGAERVNVVVGMNHFNGAQALSYARERYAYEDGDRHRGRNQQQVIQAVLNKITSDKSLLLKYDSLLSSFSQLYITDIPKELITLLIKQQLNDMSSWNFITQAVDGYGSSNQTYSMPGMMLYVMIPYEETLKTAISKIEEVYNLEN